jgi:hypothetical protein
LVVAPGYEFPKDHGCCGTTDSSTAHDPLRNDVNIIGVFRDDLDEQIALAGDGEALDNFWDGLKIRDHELEFILVGIGGDDGAKRVPERLRVKTQRARAQGRGIVQPIEARVHGPACKLKALRDPLHGGSRILVERAEDSPIGGINSGHTAQNTTDISLESERSDQ